MGKRGPPPKPSAIKKAQGTFHAHRSARNEVAPPPGCPPMPTWLDAEGRAEWRRVVPQLQSLGILSEIDGSMLADYCAAHALAIKATKNYQRKGVTVKNNGQVQRNPMIKVAQEARAQARLLAGEFGLSPSSRSRISAPDKGEGLNEANARMKATTTGEAAAADKTEDFLFGGPKLVKP